MPAIRQLRRRQDAVGEDHEARTHLVAAIGLDDPTARCLVPGRRLNCRVEQAVIVEPELLGHSLAVFQDLEARGEFHRRDVTRLIEQRQVAVGFHVAGDAGIAVPVPGAANVATLLAETHVGEASCAQLVPQQQSAEAGADDHDFAFVGERFTRNRRLRIDIVQIFLKLAFHGDVGGGAPAGFLERVVFGLLFRVEGRASRHFRQVLKLLIDEDRVALAG